MPESSFSVRAKIRSADLTGVRTLLEEMFGSGAVSESGDRSDELLLETQVKGESMKALNRSLLSSLRNVERRTTIRAEWTGKSLRESYFDYVLKKSEHL